VLTKAWIGQMRDATMPAVRSSGGARAELGVRADGVLLRSSGLHGKVHRLVVNTNRGSVRHEAHRRREIATADGISTPGGAEAIPVLQGPGSSVEAPGSFTASRQSLCRGLQGLGLGGSVWPRRRKALRSNGNADMVAAGCGGDGVVRWVRRGSARVVKRARPRSRCAGRAGDHRRSRP
jgi:hypothetical protein